MGRYTEGPAMTAGPSLFIVKRPCGGMEAGEALPSPGTTFRMHPMVCPAGDPVNSPPSRRLKQYGVKRPPGFAMDANRKVLDGSSRASPASWHAGSMNCGPPLEKLFAVNHALWNCGFRTAWFPAEIFGLYIHCKLIAGFLTQPLK